MAAYNPLHRPDEAPPFPASLDAEVKLARQYLDKVAAANIHDHEAMLRAAVGLDHRMRSLLAAIEAERGEQR